MAHFTQSFIISLDRLLNIAIYSGTALAIWKPYLDVPEIISGIEVPYHQSPFSQVLQDIRYIDDKLPGFLLWYTNRKESVRTIHRYF